MKERRDIAEPSPALSGHILPKGEGKSVTTRRAEVAAELRDFILDRLRGKKTEGEGGAEYPDGTTGGGTNPAPAEDTPATNG